MCRMFGCFLKEAKIGIWDKQKEGVMERPDIYFPREEPLLAIIDLWKMLEWTFQSYEKDWARYHSRSEARQKKIQVTKRVSFEEPKNLGMRTMARTLFHVNTVYMLDGILRQYYLDTIKYENGLFGIRVQRDKVELAKRKEEIKMTRHYRNKIAAHTSYGSPKKADTQLRQIAGLIQLGSSGIAISKLTCGLGGYMLHDPTNANHANDVPYDDFYSERYTLRDQHPKAVIHYQHWENMFTALVQKFQQKCPLETDQHWLLTKGDTPWKHIKYEPIKF